MPVVGVDPQLFHQLAACLWLAGLVVVWLGCLVVVVAGVRR